MNWSDSRLVSRCRQGDSAAFSDLLNRYERRVYSFAYSMCGNAADAEDLTQEVFVQVYRSLPSFRGDSQFSTWLYRVAMNVCLQQRRRKSLDQAPLDDVLELAGPAGTEPEHQVMRGELQEQVRSAIDRLPEKQREVVVMHETLGLTYQEIAETLAIPVGTVKSRMGAAFTTLRRLLSPYTGMEPSGPALAAAPEVNGS
jgi:RNA polymerase sigma-70 factor, ECF subfamily